MGGVFGFGPVDRDLMFLGNPLYNGVECMRLDRAQRIITRKEINGILLLNPYNIRYITGYKPKEPHSGAAAVIALDKEPWLIVPQEEVELAQSQSWVKNIQPFQNASLPHKSATLLNKIREAIEELEITSVYIGVELEYVSARRFEALKRLFPDAGFKDITEAIAEIRMIKDEAEIEQIKIATQIAENGLRAAIEFIQPGITEIEVAAEVERTIRKAGATQSGYPTVIASGSRAACPYSAASRREIGENEFVDIAVSVEFNDYCSNISRTVITGKPSKEQNQFFECARDCIIAGRNQLEPGIHVSDLATTMNQIAEERGYSEHLLNFNGNSIGLQPIERPIFSIEDDTVILPGMVFIIETAFYKPDLGGIRLSDTFVHQKDESFQILNHLPLHTV